MKINMSSGRSLMCMMQSESPLWDEQQPTLPGVAKGKHLPQQLMLLGPGLACTPAYASWQGNGAQYRHMLQARLPLQQLIILLPQHSCESMSSVTCLASSSRADAAVSSLVAIASLSAAVASSCDARACTWTSNASRSAARETAAVSFPGADNTSLPCSGLTTRRLVSEVQLTRINNQNF